MSAANKQDDELKYSNDDAPGRTAIGTAEASHKARYRIMNELREIQCDVKKPYYVSQNDENIFSMEVMFLGPPDTPYAFGHFIFQVELPRDYPQNPPNVKCSTTDSNKIRFHPNIYACGKVCLSLLGTWEGHAIESWNAAHGISSVIISIRSLMCENPYYSEPDLVTKLGNRCCHTTNSEQYNLKVTHETMRVAVIERIENILESGVELDYIASQSLYLFDCYYQRYLEVIERESPKVKEGQKFLRLPFEVPHNTMVGFFCYNELLERIKDIKQKVDKNESLWSCVKNFDIPNELLSALTAGQLMAAANNELSISAEVSLPNPETPQVWTLTIFGNSDSYYAYGVFQVRLVFPVSFPKCRPRVRFVTPIPHPYISPDGYPLYDVQDNSCILSHLLALVDLINKPCVTEPGKFINIRVANLCFGTPEEKKQFLQEAARAAQNSIE